MKLTIYGINYTGAHFRGFADEHDERDVKMVLVGNESDIVNFILNNFSYGPTDSITRLKQLVTQMKRAGADKSSSLPIFDGCGAILAIQDESNKYLVNIYTEICGTDFDTVSFIDLGTIELPVTSDNLVNDMLYKIPMPPRTEYRS
jgi:hypothetical protein